MKDRSSEVGGQSSKHPLPTTIFRGGESLEIAGDSPLYAVDAHALWVVDRGEVDIFAVKRKDGSTVGPRTHLFRASKGNFIFGAALQGLTHERCLMAVGKPGTVLVRYQKNVIQEASHSEELRKTVLMGVEAWIINMSRVIGRGVPPSGNELALDPVTTVFAAPGDVIRTHAGVTWGCPLVGDVLLMGESSLASLDSDDFFPLTRDTWLEAKEVAHVTGRSSQKVLGDPGFDAVLTRFHDIVLKGIAAREKKEQIADREYFAERIAQDHRGLEKSLFHLGALLFRKKKAPMEPGGVGTALFASVVAVAEATGIPTERISEALWQNPDDLTLDDMARAGHFFTRQVVLTPGWSGQDNGPLLGRLEDADDVRYVALLPVSAKRYDLLDPERGVRVPIDRKLEQKKRTSAYTFYRPLPPESLTIRHIMRFVMNGVWRDLITVILVGVAGALLALLIPIATGIIIDSIIPEANRGGLMQIGLILTVCVFVAFMFQTTRAIAMVRMEGRMDAGLQAAVFDRVLNLPIPFFREFTAGDLADRTLGINRIRQILSGATLTTAMAGLFSSLNLLVMFFYDWKLSLVGLAMILITVFVAGGLSLAIVRYERHIFDIEGKNSGIILQLLTGIAKLRMTGTEDRAFGVWAENFSKKKAIDFEAGKRNAALNAATSFIPMVSTMVIFWYFLRSQMSEMSTGDFLAFNAAFAAFQGALVQTAMVFAGLLHVVPLWERAKPILTTQPEVDDLKAAAPRLNGDVTAEHVSFRYIENGPRVLKDVSLEVPAGAFAAVVGASGSGKSTLLRILLGFERPESGSIYYDQHDLEHLDVKSLRRQMGVVLQSGQVMPGSILKNITGALNITLEDAWEAARMVGLAEDIEAMPMGMHTIIPPHGGTLSGGQRQRLIIARAIVRRPRILFFDEATSSLDNRTQAIVSESLGRLNVTRLVIAHRLSTIMNADRIYVMDQGRMAESGTYDELMNAKGFFYQLAVRQIA